MGMMRRSLLVIFAAASLGFVAPVRADYYGYQGRLQIQGLFGHNCDGFESLQRISLVLRDADAAGRIDGYLVLTDLLTLVHLEGTYPGELAVQQALDPSTPHPDYRLQLLGPISALGGGTVAAIGSYDGPGCFPRAGDLTLTLQGPDTKPPPRQVYDQAASLFFILSHANAASLLAQQQHYPEAIHILRETLERANSPSAATPLPIIERVTAQLAIAEQAAGNPAEAESLYRKALDLDRSVLGADARPQALLLRALGISLVAQRRRTEAEAAYRHAMAIILEKAGPDSTAYADISTPLAELLNSEGRYVEAEPLYRQILAIDEKAYGTEDQRIAAVVNNLAIPLEALGRYTEAESLYQRALKINEQTHGAQSAPVAVNLINLADLYDSDTRFNEAEPLLRRALAIEENTFGDHSPKLTAALLGLAQHLSLTERYAEAEPVLRRAMAIQKQAFGDRRASVAGPLERLGQLLHTTGRYGEAEVLLRRALAIDEQTLGSDTSAVSGVLDDLAWLLRYTGRLAEAEAAARRALAIDEQVLGPQHPRVAKDLVTLAGLMLVTKRYVEAEALDKRALAIREKTLGPDSPAVAVTLNNLTNVYQVTNRAAEAEPLLRRSLEINERRFGPDSSRVGLNLQNLAGVLSRTGRRDQALPLMLEALRIARANGNAPQVWQSPSKLMAYYGGGQPAQPSLAIYYGKLAVNTLQQLRGNLGGSEKEAQNSFVDSVAPVYRKLAELLVRSGRLGEAQQVLAMLKEQELFDYTQRSAATDVRTTVASLTPAEQQMEASGHQWIAMSKELAALKERFTREGDAFRNGPDYPRLQKLRDQVDAAQASYAAAGEAIAREGRADRSQRVADFGAGFQDTLRELGHGAVLVQYFILEDKVEVLLTTPEISIAREAPIARAELNVQINAFRTTLINRTDPLPQAQALYHLLIGPIEQDLVDASAQTLMLSLDDTLRYLPFAALHDGHGYLMERYALVLATEAARGHLVDRAANNHWTVWGLGVTLGHDEGADKFPALPMVGAELAAIAGPSGILSGELKLDPSFDKSALRDGLDRSFPIIHIASHFKFDPANAEASYLLLGDGNHLSLKEISTLNFKRVELLTLSACETALGGEGSGSHGAEVESLGAIAQNQGARAVLATLWPVADTSTALLMRTLYQQHQAQLDKADALRQAQLALLRGTVQVSALPDSLRGAIRLVPTSGVPTAANFKVDPKAPYAHPYFWAPFILMGSWQ